MAAAMKALPALLATALLLQGCNSIPAAGPRPGNVTAEAGAEQGFAFVELDGATVSALAAGASEADGESYGDLPRSRSTLGVLGAGDALRVTLWEQTPAALTMTADRAPLDVTVRVAQDGSVSVPYAGRLRAAGSTPARLESAIRGALDGQARGLQVSVGVVDDQTSSVTVSGDVARPGRVPLLSGARMLSDVLATAGGARATDRLSLARVRRGGSVAARDLRTLAEDPGADIELAPGDRVFVTKRDNAVFHAFGAVNRPGEQPIDFGSPTLARALSRVAGLDPNRADATSVFLYRPRPPGAAAPVVHRLDLRRAGGFLLAENVRLRSGDILYVGEAPIAEVAKIIQLVTGFGSVANSARSLGTLP